METSIKILHLEDNPNDAQLVQSVLKKANLKFEYFFADNKADYILQLQDHKIDIILSDYNLPDYSGNGALLFAKDNYPNVPFVFVSGTIGEDAAIESMLHGATDYVLKNKIGRLVPAIQRSIKDWQEHKARMVAEQELEKKSRALEQSPNSVVITDTNGIIEYVNPATVKLSGYTREELIGKNHKILNYTENAEEVALPVWKKVSAGKVWHGEFYNRKKFGERYWEAVSIAPVLDNNGTITNYVTIKEDITDRKQMTQDLIAAKEKAEGNERLKTAFLHNISHEIRTPLNAIVGFSEFLNDPDLGAENRKNYTEIICKNSEKLLTIISDIVNLSTIEAGQEKVNEAELNLNFMLKLLHEKFVGEARNNNLTLNIKPFLPYEARIVSDEAKLMLVLTNLISNALKYTKEGEVTFGYVIKANELEFFVEDTGIGIAPEMHKEIFKRFRQVGTTITSQCGGIGLGLAISKAYIELLGGKMWVVSGLNQGSTFYFTIPYIKAISNISSDRKSHNASQIKMEEPKTILVAEDEDSNFQLVQALLNNIDIRIVRAITGNEAVATCKSKHVDVVLMDIMMPEMDGYEAIKQIRELMPTLPIIAQTAYASTTDMHKAMACGCTDFISKPFSRDLLISKVKEHLYKK